MASKTSVFKALAALVSMNLFGQGSAWASHENMIAATCNSQTAQCAFFDNALSKGHNRLTQQDIVNLSGNVCRENNYSCDKSHSCYRLKNVRFMIVVVNRRDYTSEASCSDILNDGLKGAARSLGKCLENGGSLKDCVFLAHKWGTGTIDIRINNVFFALEAQHALKKAGLYRGVLDGSFGASSQAALRNFLQKYLVFKHSGKVDKLALQYLRQFQTEGRFPNFDPPAKQQPTRSLPQAPVAVVLAPIVTEPENPQSSSKPSVGVAPMDMSTVGTNEAKLPITAPQAKIDALSRIPITERSIGFFPALVITSIGWGLGFIAKRFGGFNTIRQIAMFLLGLFFAVIGLLAAIMLLKSLHPGITSSIIFYLWGFYATTNDKSFASREKRRGLIEQKINFSHQEFYDFLKLNNYVDQWRPQKEGEAMIARDFVLAIRDNKHLYEPLLKNLNKYDGLEQAYLHTSNRSLVEGILKLTGSIVADLHSRDNRYWLRPISK